jgi:hypothetical protein
MSHKVVLFDGSGIIAAARTPIVVGVVPVTGSSGRSGDAGGRALSTAALDAGALLVQPFIIIIKLAASWLASHSAAGSDATVSSEARASAAAALR